MTVFGCPRTWMRGSMMICLLGMTHGCSTSRYMHVRGAAAQEWRPAEPSRVETATSRESAVLKAVEAFLEKTEDYQLRATLTPDTTMEAAVALPSARDAALPPGSATRGKVIAVANSQVDIMASSPAEPQLALPVIESLTIRGAVTPKQDAQDQRNANTTNAPIDAQPSEGQLSVDRMLAFLAGRAKAQDDFDSAWELAMTRHVFHRPPVDDSVGDAGGMKLGQEPSRLLDALVAVAEAVRNVARNPLVVGHESLERVKNLQRLLADRADPVVRGIALSRKVVTFGVFEETPPESMIAGRTLQTIVYSEILNLRSELTETGQHRSVIRTRLELLDPDGKSVWQHEEPEIVDLCRSKRTDFFIAQRVSWPPTIPAGNYVLKVMAEDKLSGLAGEASVVLTILSPATVAAAN